MIRILYRWMIFPALAAVFVVSGCKVVPPTLPTIAPTSTPLPTHTYTPVATDPPTPTPRPTHTRAPSPAPGNCKNPESSIVDDQIASNLLGEPFQFRVYLPPCYTTEPEKPYPVLYLFHGQQQDATLWEKLGALKAIDSLILSGASQPFLIVMPTERHFLLELQDTKFDQAVVEELVPAIDKNYPTCKRPSCRAVGGISRGAAWAVRVGFSHPDLFHYIGAHSPAVFGSDLARLPVILRAIKPEDIPLTYIDTGRTDIYRDSAIQLEGLLTQFGVPHEWHMNEGGHDLDYWYDHISEYMAWYAQNWP